MSRLAKTWAAGTSALLASLALIGTARADTTAASKAKSEVAVASKSFLDRVTAKDALGAAAFYSDDAYLIGATTYVRGRKEVQALYEKILPTASMTMQSVELKASPSGDMVIDTGAATFPAQNNATGKYVMVWKKQPDRQWKLIRVMLNMDQ